MHYPFSRVSSQKLFQRMHQKLRKKLLQKLFKTVKKQVIKIKTGKKLNILACFFSTWRCRLPLWSDVQLHNLHFFSSCLLRDDFDFDWWTAFVSPLFFWKATYFWTTQLTSFTSKTTQGIIVKWGKKWEYWDKLKQINYQALLCVKTQYCMQAGTQCLELLTYHPNNATLSTADTKKYTYRAIHYYFPKQCMRSYTRLLEFGEYKVWNLTHAAPNSNAAVLYAQQIVLSVTTT